MDSLGRAEDVPAVGAEFVVPSPRPDTIVRDRLVALLDEAVERRLTVITAPAGDGKTTAVATWLETVDRSGAWLSLDALDNDPRRLCARLLAALDAVLPGAIDDARSALSDGSGLLELVVPLTLNALADHARQRLVVVLDDYHLVENPDCHALLLGLIDGLPATARVIVCSRTRPPLRLARRRLLGMVSELGPEELRFPDEESARDPYLTSTEVAAYLAEEAIESIDPRVREFLRRTSILSRLSGPLCTAVLEDPAAPELLDDVRSSLFVTMLDDEWLRYHHLFAELLQRRLRATSPELVPVLHRRASTWFAANGFPEEAIRHAGEAGDGERAARLLYDSWRVLLGERRHVTLRRLIAELPSDRGALAGFCEAVDALCMGLDGVDLRLVAQRLDALEPLRDSPGVAEIIDYARISHGYGDIGRAIADGWAALARHSDTGMHAELAAKLGIVLWFAGERDVVRDLVEPYVRVIACPSGRSSALATLALTAVDDGDADLAERYAREAVEVGAAHGDGGALECHFAYVALAEALRLRGALEEAGEQLSRAAQLTSMVPGSVFQAFTLVFEAQLALSRHDRARARSRAAAARAIIDRYPDVGTIADRLARVEATVARRGDDDLRGSEPTAAELRVLAWLPSDLTLEQIASELYLSVHTVKSHRRRLYQRLGVTSREEAVAAARDRGLL